MIIFTPLADSIVLADAAVSNLDNGIYRFSITTAGSINIDGNDTHFTTGTHFVYVTSAIDADSAIRGQYQLVRQGYKS